MASNTVVWYDGTKSDCTVSFEGLQKAQWKSLVQAFAACGSSTAHAHVRRKCRSLEMVPPIKRQPSMKRNSFMLQRQQTFKLAEPEQFTIAQLKATLRAADVSEHDISLCIERSQLNTLYKEKLDKKFNACVSVQRHWRQVLEYRKVLTFHFSARIVVNLLSRMLTLTHCLHWGAGKKNSRAHAARGPCGYRCP